MTTTQRMCLGRRSARRDSAALLEGGVDHAAASPLLGARGRAGSVAVRPVDTRARGLVHGGLLLLEDLRHGHDEGVRLAAVRLRVGLHEALEAYRLLRHGQLERLGGVDSRLSHQKLGRHGVELQEGERVPHHLGEGLDIRLLAGRGRVVVAAVAVAVAGARPALARAEHLGLRLDALGLLVHAPHPVHEPLPRVLLRTVPCPDEGLPGRDEDALHRRGLVVHLESDVKLLHAHRADVLGGHRGIVDHALHARHAHAPEVTVGVVCGVVLVACLAHAEGALQRDHKLVVHHLQGPHHHHGGVDANGNTSAECCNVLHGPEKALLGDLGSAAREEGLDALAAHGALHDAPHGQHHHAGEERPLRLGPPGQPGHDVPPNHETRDAQRNLEDGHREERGHTKEPEPRVGEHPPQRHVPHALATLPLASFAASATARHPWHCRLRCHRSDALEAGHGRARGFSATTVVKPSRRPGQGDRGPPQRAHRPRGKLACAAHSTRPWGCQS
mmetsp:Transcript_1501/g.5906  ORF Transcript_1501/g.5906 Transcript_1501/m.5906 type:complete len:502 (+) Transcript_1501:89-1594(+)